MTLILNDDALIKISEHIYFIKNSTNIGLIAIHEKKELYLIDSANDDYTIEVVVDFIEKHFEGYKIKAVMNTHSHADHCGGNDWLVKNRNAEVWCPEGEASLMEYPIIETGLIWGGTPVHELRSNFLLAKPCSVDYVLKGEFSLSIGDDGAFSDNSDGEVIKIKPIELPGHYLNQAGYLITDSDGKSSFFLGDAISGRNILKRYWIQYLLDELKSKESLLRIENIKADFYIPGHGDMVNEIEGLAELNLLALLETENLILDCLKDGPKSHEEILKEVADRNQIRLGVSQFVLIGSTIRSYLTGLYESGKIAFELTKNRMLWKLK